MLQNILEGAIQVVNPFSFVSGAVNMIRSFVKGRAKSLSSKYKDVGPQTTFERSDSIFGLTSIKYAVVR